LIALRFFLSPSFGTEGGFRSPQGGRSWLGQFTADTAGTFGGDVKPFFGEFFFSLRHFAGRISVGLGSEDVLMGRRWIGQRFRGSSPFFLEYKTGAILFRAGFDGESSSCMLAASPPSFRAGVGRVSGLHLFLRY